MIVFGTWDAITNDKDLLDDDDKLALAGVVLYGCLILDGLKSSCPIFTLISNRMLAYN